MSVFLKKVHHTISKKVQKAHETYKKHAEDTCVPGYNYKKCIQKNKIKKLEKINQGNKRMIDRQTKIERPNSYTKVLNRHYHTGVLNKTNDSICNNNLNNASFINKYTYAQKRSASFTGGSAMSDIHGHHINCSTKCKENFGNFSNNTSWYNNKRKVNILLLILLIICLIPYLYFFIKQFMGKGKKKY
jgi:hypothetical protein